MTEKKTNIEKKVKSKISFKEENQKLKKLLKEKDEKLIRNHADFQNFQKRMQKELIIKEEEIKKKYISEFIDIYELIVQAYEDKNSKNALKLIIKNIEIFLKNEKIQYINCIGEKFDHNIHHAISTIEKDDCDENVIINEIKKGYIIDNKLLRPSQVVVAKKKEKE
jgi:molecular chaperone GrpE